MKRWLRAIIGGLERFSRPPQGSVDRSRLVGMYLTQANRPPGAGARGSETRERQDGKYSQQRRRT
jgi:hypothetical protein